MAEQLTPCAACESRPKVVDTSRVQYKLANLERLTQALHEIDEDAYALSVALSHAVEGIARMDHEGRFLWINPAYCRLCGFLPEDIIGKHWTDIPDLIIDQDRDLAAHAYLEMLRTGRSQVEVRGLRYPDKSLYWRLITMVPATDRIGRFIGHFRFVQDITHRKAGEEHIRRLIGELEERESRFSSAFKYSKVAMGLVDKDGKFLDVNPAYCQMLGYSHEEMLTKRWCDVTHPDDIASDEALAKKLLAGEIDCYDLRKRYLTKSGAVVPVWLVGSTVRRPDGIFLYYVAQAIDMTELEAAKAQLLEIKRQQGV